MDKYLFIGFGGVLGAISRYWLGLGIAGLAAPGFPWGTFIINLSGCFLLGLFLTFSQEKLEIDPRLRLGLATGFLGAYTTFSTFSVETLAFLNQGYWVQGITYVIASVILGIILVWLGMATARSLASKDKQKQLRAGD